MLVIQLLRNDLAGVAARLATRGFELDTAAFEQLENQRKALQVQSEEAQAKVNTLSKQIGELMKQGKREEAEAVKAEVAQVKALQEQLNQDLPRVQAALDDLLLRIPNLPHSSVPVGKDETENVEVRKVGTPKTFDFAVKDHVDLGAALGLDFEKAAELSGARFSLMKGKVARLHRALAQFMLDTHTQQHGYTECYTPYIVSDAALLGTGQLPKFAEDLFHVTRGGDEQIVAIPDSHGGGYAHQHRARRDCGGERFAVEVHRAFALFPQRSGFARQGHARAYSSASV